jgi:dipeptidyl aminopeptidase/acylaminoacyl peptidase
MKKIFLLIVIICTAIIIGIIFLKPNNILTPIGKGTIYKEKKLAQYSYTALQKTKFLGSEINIDKVLKDEKDFTSYLFYFTVRGKKVSGLMNIPKKSGNFPAIVMIRGYVDKEIYVSGVGTSHGGELMAQNGFITLAPDFLGYGYSDNTSPDAMEDRFLTYVTVLELISSTKNFNSSLENKSLLARFDNKNIGIWGHSNGGQIALSVLEISGVNYPTVLWAPVSKPFPYSILYYTDDINDHGKALRKVVADFEKNYDAEKYSLTNYLDWIKTSLQIHQGGADEAVPQKWSDTLVETLKKKEKEIEYFTYADEDHNFSQGNWGLVMQRTMAFYKKYFSEH